MTPHHKSLQEQVGSFVNVCLCVCVNEGLLQMHRQQMQLRQQRARQSRVLSE